MCCRHTLVDRKVKVVHQVPDLRDVVLRKKGCQRLDVSLDPEQNIPLKNPIKRVKLVPGQRASRPTNLQSSSHAVLVGDVGQPLVVVDLLLVHVHVVRLLALDAPVRPALPNNKGILPWTFDPRRHG